MTRVTTTSERESYSYADHLDEHPEIATRELSIAIRGLRAKGWRKRKLISEVSALASMLKIPNNHHRNSQFALISFLDSLCWPLHCQVVIDEKGIAKGVVLANSTVRRVGRDRQVYLENGERVNPCDLDPSYNELNAQMYKHLHPTD